MLYDYFVRITHSYADASGVIRAWATRASKMVVYEHVGEATKKTHIHLLILGANVCSKQLRNIAAKYVDMKGNEMASFKAADDHFETALIYMTKGNLEPKYLQGYTVQDSDIWKSKWKVPAHYNAIKETPSEKLYNSVFDDDNEVQINYEYWVKELSVDTVNSYAKEGVSLRWIWLKQFCRNQAFWHNHRIWNMKTQNDYKMLVLTYCFRNNISIPSNDKDWKKYL